MPNRPWNFLLDIPAYPADRYAPLADRIGKLMGTKNDVLLIQAEAVLALEAVAASLARPGLKALNIVTSPYGTWFGGWLAKGGATVFDVRAAPAMPITPEAVRQALEEAGDIDVLAIVHAESASGILNPLEEIVALAKARGILTVVDAVASIGGHALPVDALGIDIAVIGPQKSLAGPAGISAISVSEKAWQSLLHDYAPLGSMLSLLDQKRQWLEIGRGALPGTPPALEFFALEAALDRLEAEGVAAAVTRHAAAADATHEALNALGVHLWVPRKQSSALVTAVRLPDGIAAAPLLVLAKRDGADLSAGVGPGAARLVRLNHTGQRASQQAVAANIEALGEALLASGQRVDLPAALEAVETVYRQNPAKL